MNLVKIGKFLQELRKEKGLTQEQLAEQMGVARRTVSRWETGSNMPDMDILIELSDFYVVDLREILNGERKSEHMNEKMKATYKIYGIYKTCKPVYNRGSKKEKRERRLKMYLKKQWLKTSQS